VSATSLAYDDYDITYAINVVSQTTVPLGGKVIVTFPTEFHLSGSSPTPRCGGVNVEEATKGSFSCVVSVNAITVSGLKEMPGGSTIQIAVAGIKNPSSSAGATSGTFTVVTRNSADLLIDSKTDVTGVTFTAARTTQTLLLTSSTVHPENELVYADYDITFTTISRVPVDGSIKVSFPQGKFSSLQEASTFCAISGAVDTYKSCTFNSNSVTIVTDA
jgi:hypothetical protein